MVGIKIVYSSSTRHCIHEYSAIAGNPAREARERINQNSFTRTLDRRRLMELQKIFKSRTKSGFATEIYILQEFQFWII
jgi:hypothetical protein